MALEEVVILELGEELVHQAARRAGRLEADEMAVGVGADQAVDKGRVEDGRRNHDFVAERIEMSPWIEVPAKLEREERAPDSLQFNLVGMDREEMRAFAETAAAMGVKVQVFGLSSDNARAFWNWQFLREIPELPQTRAMLERACDTRLPARLTLEECAGVADILINAAEAVMGETRAYGT